MTKIKDAQERLKALGLPAAQQNEMSALSLLALAGLGPDDSWSQAHRHGVTVTKGVMAFVPEAYGKNYAPNTRETFRRQVLHQFVQARVADYNPFEPDLPTNSPHAHYALTEAALTVIRAYGTEHWDVAVREFIAQQGSLVAVYQRKRARRLVPVRMPDGMVFELSPGRHNELQVAVVEEFVPRFAPGARLLYLGDTANKNLYVDDSGLTALGVTVTEHEKLPDIILHDAERGWLLLVEVVTAHGPMTPKRVVELESMFVNCAAGLVFVSAFPDLVEFRKHIKEVAWDTEVWIAGAPDHLIHFNGDRFLGPRK